LSSATEPKGTPARSSIDFNTLTTVIFIVSLLAIALLTMQLRILNLDQGPSGSGHGQGGQGSGNGTGQGRGAGNATTPEGGGNGASGVNESAKKLGYGPSGGGNVGMENPTSAPVTEEKPTSTTVDNGRGDAGKAEGRDIDTNRPSQTAGAVQMGTNSTSGGGGGGGGNNGIQIPQINLPEKLKWLILIITVAAIGTAMAYLMRSYMKARRESLRRAAKAKGKRKKRIPQAVAAAVTDEFVQTIEMTCDTLAKMGDIRKAIALCYARMCGIIADKGLIRGPEITPREFYTAVRQSFDVESRSMKGLTVLFEEAVYSEHPMGEAHRGSALKLLKGAVEEVKTW
jgi:hypothetical protein